MPNPTRQVMVPFSLSDKEWYSPRSAATLADDETLSGLTITTTSAHYGYSVSTSTFLPGMPRNASQLREAAAALRQLLLLPVGWDSYGAPPIDIDAAVAALVLVDRLTWEGGRVPRIVPTVEGGVQLEWYGNGIDLQIEVAPTQDASVFYRDSGTEESWEGSLGEEPEQLEKLIYRAGMSA